MIYIVTDTESGEEVYRYQADAAIEWNGMEFSTHTHTEFVELAEGEVAAPTKRRLTKQEFFDKLGPMLLVFYSLRQRLKSQLKHGLSVLTL